MTQIKNSTNKFMLLVVGLVLSAVTFTQGVFTRLGSGLLTSNIDISYADVPTSGEPSSDSNCFVTNDSNCFVTNCQGQGTNCSCECGMGCCVNGTQDGTCGNSFGCNCC